MSSEIAGLENEVKSLQKQLDEVAVNLQDAPNNAGLHELKTSLEEAIELMQSTIDELRPQVEQATGAAQQAAPPPPPPPSEQPKWSIENHPAFQNKKPARQPSPEEPQAPVVFKTGDLVLAKWVSGDKAFHPARITAVTGSSANPLYNVKFKDHGDSQSNLRKEAIKPIRQNDAKKRKADASPAPAPASSSAAATNPGIISAGPNIDLSLAQAKREPSRAGDGSSRPAKVPKTLKGKGALEKGKSNWQDFQKKNKAGKTKESMFRTGEGVNARVGIIGSGQTMRKDGVRSKHVYHKHDEDV